MSLRGVLGYCGFEDYGRLPPATKSSEEEEPSRARQRWLYCIVVGCILVVLVIIFFGGITWVQYHRQLPTFNVAGGVITNYRTVESRPASGMTFNLTCDNPADQEFTVSSGKLDLLLNYDGKYYTIAVVETEAFKLREREKNRPFLGRARDAQWQIPLDSVAQVEQSLSSAQGLPVVLHGRLTTHYSASRVLRNISRTVTVTRRFWLRLSNSG